MAGLQEAWGVSPTHRPAAPRVSAAGGRAQVFAGVSHLPERGFQERAVSRGPAPPSSFPGRPRGAADYTSSPHLLGDDCGLGTRRPEPSRRSLRIIAIGASSLFPVLKALVIAVIQFILLFPLTVQI